MRVIVLAAALVAALAAQPVSAQAQTAEFRLKLAKEEALFYATTTTLTSTFEIGNAKMDFPGDGAARVAVRVLDVEQDGTMLIEQVAEEQRVTVGGTPNATLDDPETFRVRPDSRVMRPEASEGAEFFPFKLPDRPVAVGESWSDETPIKEAGVKGKATMTFTLVALERVDGEQVARIRAVGDGKVTGSALLVEGLTTQTRTTGTIKSTGEIQWSLDRGRMLRSSDNFDMNMESQAFGGGIQLRIVMAVKSATRREPLIGVAPPEVTPDVLIEPGKAVGPFLLAVPVPEHNNLFGPPRPGPGEWGLRAQAIVWQTGLVGYLDPSDQTKLVGFQVRDRVYRTGKGVGFGSSEGAVLLAHGLSPVRVPLSATGQGSVRMLIYDDLGIAFAITADKTRAGVRGASRIGTVDWTVVFPPGGAGKIFPMP